MSIAPSTINYFDLATEISKVRPFALAIVAAATGLALSVFAWFAVAAWEHRLAEQDFANSASDQAQTLQAGLDEYLHQLVALRAFFNASNDGVSRTEFNVFVKDLLDEHKAILSFSWMPRIRREDRSAHEAAGLRDGISNYHIKMVGSDGRMSWAPDQAEYFPVYYSVEPLTAPSYGINLQDGGVRQRPLDRARDNDRPATSDSFRLQSGLGDRNGFFVALPVYRRDLSHDTLDDRRSNLVGFVQGVFQFNVMIDAILRRVKSPLNILLYDGFALPDSLPVQVHAEDPERARLTAKSQAIAAPLKWEGDLSAGDRHWQLVIVPPFGSSSLARYGRAWLVFLAGILITGLVIGYMWNSIRHLHRLRTLNKAASTLARTDGLTRLANRRAFIERLTVAFAEVARGSPPFAVHFIDIDEFKDINDTQGHATGDLLLKELARRLTGAVRANDLVARFGGDEFAILQAGVNDASAAAALASKIIKMLAAPFTINGFDLCVSASIGIALHSEQVDGPKAIMMQADLALYRAKNDGRNAFRFHSGELDQQVHLRVNLAEELRGAITRDELELYYQPQVEIESGRILGLEALVRWNHPKRGLIMPSIFIPIAEKSAIIQRLGSWTFDAACAQLAKWEHSGIAPQTLAVNVSGMQIRRIDDFERDITASLTKWNIKRGAIELELTETVLMKASQKNSDVFQRLRQMGLRIAIDDFGTGYSSLKYLTLYPVNRLKIAQELVFRVTDDPRNATVVRAAIRLAGELGIEAIAEGVETEAQAQFLLSEGCAYAQGFHYSRPVRAAAATVLLEQGLIGAPEASAQLKKCQL